MNIYARRNMIEQWWEMCLESDRTHWVSVMDRTSSDFMETIDPDIIRIDAMRIWGHWYGWLSYSHCPAASQS